MPIVVNISEEYQDDINSDEMNEGIRTQFNGMEVKAQQMSPSKSDFDSGL